jgi:hypothetical protein
VSRGRAGRERRRGLGVGERDEGGPELLDLTPEQVERASRGETDDPVAPGLLPQEIQGLPADDPVLPSRIRDRIGTLGPRG